MSKLGKLRDTMMDELEMLADKSELSRSDLDTIFKLIDVVKDINEVEMYQGSDYSDDYVIGAKKNRDETLTHIESMMTNSALTLDDKSALKKAVEMMRR